MNARNDHFFVRDNYQRAYRATRNVKGVAAMDSSRSPILLPVSSVLVSIFVLFHLAYAKDGVIGSQYDAWAIISSLLIYPIFNSLGAWKLALVPHLIVVRLMGSWLMLFVTFVGLAFVTKYSESFSREVILQWAFFGFLLDLFIQIFIRKRYLQLRRAHDADVKKIVIHTADAESEARSVALSIGEEGTIIPCFSFDETGVGAAEGSLRAILRESKCHRVYICTSNRGLQQAEWAYLYLVGVGQEVSVVLTETNAIFAAADMDTIQGFPVLKLTFSSIEYSVVSWAFKGMIDRFLALSMLVLLAPVFILIAFLVRLSSSGPIFYRQPRSGAGGKTFDIYKFRTLYTAESGDEIKQVLSGDSRVTSVGRFLRTSSLDELPQLLNILKGDMSFVGPRPHAVQHDEKYNDLIDNYMARYKVKPGLTGLAQVSGLRGPTETIDKMQARVQKDIEYISNWSLLLDIKIMISTPFSLFTDTAV